MKTKLGWACQITHRNGSKRLAASLPGNFPAIFKTKTAAATYHNELVWALKDSALRVVRVRYAEPEVVK